MENRIIFGLGALAAIIEGLAGGMVPMGLLPLLLVVLGLAYGFMSLDAEDSTMFVAVAIGLGAATQADVLSNIHVIGGYLDAITDQLRCCTTAASWPLSPQGFTPASRASPFRAGCAGAPLKLGSRAACLGPGKRRVPSLVGLGVRSPNAPVEALCHSSVGAA